MRAGIRGPILSSEAIVRSECRGEGVGMRMSLQSSQREEDRCGCWALLLIFGSKRWKRRRTGHNRPLHAYGEGDDSQKSFSVL